MRKNVASSVAFLLASSCLSLATPALAQPTQASASDRATARALAEEGGEALDKKNYEIAADRFARADALVHAPTLLIELARAQVGLRKFVEAQETYLRILREGVAPGSPPAFARANQDAQKEIKAIPPKLGWVTINVTGSNSFVVTIDGTEVPKAALDVKRAVNPGGHLVRATAEGAPPAEASLSIGEGESTSVSLALKPVPRAVAKAPLATPVPRRAEPSASMTTDDISPRSSSSQKTWGMVALGVGSAGLIVGSVAGVMAIGRHGELQSACPGGKCGVEEQDTLDRFRGASTVATVGFVVGAAGAVLGTTLLLTAPNTGEARPLVQAYVGPMSVGAKVTFR